MIKYRYSSNQIDVAKDTLKSAIDNDKYIRNECWINAIYDL